MAKQIQVKDLKVEEYEFVDKDKNHIFSIKFNPVDINITQRYEEVQQWMNTIAVPDEATADDILKISDELSEKLDYMLGAKESTDISQYANPFTPMQDGRLYIEVVMDSIGELIESEMNVRLKKVNSRMEKYTAKYNR